jgi:TM2 domain-containing membrane protein YozV
MAAEWAPRLHGKYCGACGLKLIDETARSCPRCGAAFGPAPAVPRKSRIAAALLAFFFGGVGAHRFYLGQWGLGLLHVAFVWTMIPAIVALVDFIRLIAMPDERFARIHGQREGGGALVAAGVVVAWLIVAGVAAALLVPSLLQRVAAGQG